MSLSVEKFLCPSDRSGPISQDGLATFVRSPNDPQFISCTILAFAFFCFFFIFFLPFSAIFQVMASQQPNLQFFLLRHLGFCTFLSFVYLNIFCLIVSYFRRLGSENPQWSTIYLSQQIFHRQTNFVFFKLLFFEIISVFSNQDFNWYAKKVLSAVFFYQNTFSRGDEF